MGKDHPDADLHPEATGLAAATVKVSLRCYCYAFYPLLKMLMALGAFY